MNMGRTLANITIALCLTALSASCAHDNAYVDIDDPGMHDIELSGTNPFTVNFRASAEWYARIFYEQGDTTWSTSRRRKSKHHLILANWLTNRQRPPCRWR
ncbi:MAG: hypothetical protein ACLUZZ_05710 [Alistipes inops]